MLLGIYLYICTILRFYCVRINIFIYIEREKNVYNDDDYHYFSTITYKTPTSVYSDIGNDDDDSDSSNNNNDNNNRIPHIFFSLRSLRFTFSIRALAHQTNTRTRTLA